MIPGVETFFYICLAYIVGFLLGRASVLRRVDRALDPEVCPFCRELIDKFPPGKIHWCDKRR